MSSENMKAKRDFWEFYEKDISEMKVGEIAYVPESYVNKRKSKVFDTIVKRGMPVSEKQDVCYKYPVIRTEKGIYLKRENRTGDYGAWEAFHEENDKTEKKKEKFRKEFMEGKYVFTKPGEISLFEAGVKSPLIRITGIRGKVFEKFSDV